MMNTRWMIATVLCATLGSAARLWAQTQSTHNGFIDAAIFSDPDDTYNGPTSGTAGLGLAVGFGSSRSTVQFEFGLPQWHVKDSSTLVSPYFYTNTNPSLPGSDRPGSIFYLNRTVRRTVSYDLLYARHLHVTNRIQVAWLGGGGFAQRRRHDTGTSRLTLSTGAVVKLDSYDDQLDEDNHLVATVGVDAEILVMRHLAVVPELRVHAYPGAVLDDSCCGPAILTVKPTIAVRWRF